jgi:RNA polymerase sigma-70 factor (ECF subfamily)
MNVPGFSGAPSPQHFATTHWSVVSLAGKNQSPQSAAALEKLCRVYWPPLYAFIRRQGFSDADAQDLTQEFFARLLERNDFEVMDSRKGKFRTFLLAALTHFLANERDRHRAAKRGSGQAVLSLDELQAEHQNYHEPATTVSPDRIFDARWAMQVLEQALVNLRKEMTDEGKGVHFELLKPFLTQDPGDGDYVQAADKLSASRQAVAVMVFRLRRRYRELVRSEVAHTVCSPLEVDDEMRYLMGVVSL